MGVLFKLIFLILSSKKSLTWKKQPIINTNYCDKREILQIIITMIKVIMIITIIAIINLTIKINNNFLAKKLMVIINNLETT